MYWRRDVRPIKFAEMKATNVSMTQRPSAVVNQDESITIQEVPRECKRIFDICDDLGRIKHAEDGGVFQDGSITSCC